jgi:UDP-N-acetylmuramoyl-L-alanyl-D-glutamate--2,6-diaminopimelate ligase
MLLQYLIEDLEDIKVIGDTKKEINKIEYNSKKIGDLDVFVAIKGYSEDGNKYIKEAVSKGATAIIIENEKEIDAKNETETNIESSVMSENKIQDFDFENSEVTIIKVNDIRKVLAIISAKYYDFPSKKLTLIGITGTKGKTTTAYMLRDILNASGKKTGMIGTIYNTYNDIKLDATRTSPESLDLHKLFRDMVDAGITFVVMEVSSHALELDRVYGLKFATSIFTNLSEEHLDFHKTMDNYLVSKTKLFKISDYVFLNGDDIYTPRIKKEITCKVATYGLDNAVNLTATDIRINASYVEFKMYVNKMLETIKINIPGRFTVYNALAAIGVASLFNCQMDTILLALGNVQVPGRCEVIKTNKIFTIMIDYAHTSSSLESILLSVKRYAKGRIICVFGCGGNRDTSKRAAMGEISGRLSDFTVITTDNPRNEEPIKICKQVEEGILKTKGLYKIIENRKEAIKFAMRIAWKNDIILIAGKGHETYQELKGGKKINFDERIVIKEILDNMLDKNIEN